jgi:translation initiation factor 1
MRDENPTVYSTSTGRHCPKCGRPLAECICNKKTSRPAGDGVVRIFRESKGRKGKTVTLITGLTLKEDALRELLTELKRKVGTGGALKDGVLEIQGDHRDTLLEELNKRGICAKKAGG